MAESSISEKLGQYRQAFVDGVPARVGQMQALVECAVRGEAKTRDGNDVFDELAQLAHALKGSAGMFSFAELGAAAGRLEDEARGEKPGGVAKWFEEVELHASRLSVNVAETEAPELTESAPLESDPLESGKQPMESEGKRADSVRVLMVDDEEIVRKVAGLIAERAGVTLVSVPGQPEALDAIRRESFDLILMDMHVGSFHGADIAREIRHAFGVGGAVDGSAATDAETMDSQRMDSQRLDSQTMDSQGGGPTPKTAPPIVALSASEDPADWQRAVAAGMVDRVEKPLRQKDLESLIARHTS